MSECEAFDVRAEGALWGQVRGALDSRDGLVVKRALGGVMQAPWTPRQHMLAYIRDVVSRDLSLLDSFEVPMVRQIKLAQGVGGWVDASKALSQYVDPQADRIYEAGHCLPNDNVPAMLPLSGILGQVGYDVMGPGWDLIIWEEVAYALRLIVDVLKYQAVDLYAIKTKQCAAAGDTDGAMLMAREARRNGYRHTRGALTFEKEVELVRGILSGDKVRDDLADMRRHLAPMSELVEVVGGGDPVASVAHSFSAIYRQALGEGASSLVALAGVYLRIRSFWVHRLTREPLDVNAAWEAALRRLYRKAWEMGKVTP